MGDVLQRRLDVEGIAVVAAVVFVLGIVFAGEWTLSHLERDIN